MAYDPNRSFVEQAQDILTEEGVALVSDRSFVTLPGSNLIEAAAMLTQAASEIPLDHIINSGRPNSRSHHEGE